MLRRHDLRHARLPAIYASQARVAKALDRLSRLELVLEQARNLCALYPSLSCPEHGWGDEGPFPITGLSDEPPPIPAATLVRLTE